MKPLNIDVLEQVRLSALAATAAAIVSGLVYTWVSSSSASALVCRSPARPMARLELMFGTSRNDGPHVSDADWTTFLEGEITPRFPEGLTVLRAPGQWLARDGHIVREDSRILVIWYEPTRHTNHHIEAIRSAYREQFDQESVMRVDSTSCVSF